MSDEKILKPEEVNAFIVDLVKLYVPCDTGDDKFKEIAKDYVAPYGTTCGFLPHWALYRAGCRNPKVINRKEPADNLTYSTGMNLSRLWTGGRPPFENYKNGMVFVPGDILYIYDGVEPPKHNPNSEHVFIYLGEETVDGVKVMVSADAGQTNSKGQQCARIIKRVWDGAWLGKSKNRKIVGRLSPAKLTYTAPASLRVVGQ